MARHTISMCSKSSTNRYVKKTWTKLWFPKPKWETKTLDQTYCIPFLTNLEDEIIFKGVGFVIPKSINQIKGCSYYYIISLPYDIICERPYLSEYLK